MTKKIAICQWCRGTLPERHFDVAWGVFCSAECATEFRHVMTGDKRAEEAGKEQENADRQTSPSPAS